MRTATKYVSWTLLAACTSVLLAGCGEDLHEAHMRESLDRMEQLVEILEAVTENEATFGEATQQVRTWAAELGGRRERYAELGELSAKEEAALRERHRARTDALGARMQTQIQRLTSDPALSAHFAEVISEIPKAMQALPE